MNINLNHTKSTNNPAKFCPHCGSVMFKYRVLALEKTCATVELKISCREGACREKNVIVIKIDLIAPH